MLHIKIPASTSNLGAGFDVLDVSLIHGDISGLSGNADGIDGDATGIKGNLDDCKISAKNRKDGIKIEDLVVN